MEIKEIDLFYRCKGEISKIGKPTKIKEIIERIKTDQELKKHSEWLRKEKDKGKKREYKTNNLECVTWGGIFNKRSKIGLKIASGLSCYDIDIYEKDNSNLIEQLKKDPYVVSVFVSPSGGVKFVVKIPFVEDHEKYNFVYLQCLNYYKKYEPKQDTSTQDVSRLCFLSYDPNIYFNEDAKEYPIDWNKKEEVIIKEKKIKPKQIKSNSKIPSKCKFFEEIACKITLNSNNIPRHTYLDSNAWLYLHNKKDLFEKYKKVQGRDDSSFNDANKRDWSCPTIVKYLENSEGEGIQKGLEICKDCKFFKDQKKKYAKDLEDKTIFVSKYIDEEKGLFLEQVYDGKNTQYCMYNIKTEEIKYIEQYENNDLIYKPIGDQEVINKHIVLSSKAENYNSDEELDNEITSFINKWLDIPGDMLLFAKWNIKRSWVYERFYSINYLRALGDFGGGKTRYLDTLGCLHYKSIATSGATTSAPIFRIINKWKGTLIIDEADLKQSDESEDMIKIINLGFEKGKSIMRCDQNNANKIDFFDPFCPKLLGSRREFQDKATESRCITTVMKGTERKDIPRNLDEDFFNESQTLRNKLLMWRFKNYYKIDPRKTNNIDFGDIEPRIEQMINSLIPLFNTDKEINVFKIFIKEKQEEVMDQRKNSFEGKVLEALYNLTERDILDICAKDVVEESGITNKNGVAVKPETISKSLKILGFKPSKNRRVDGIVKKCIPLEKEHLDILFKKYGYGVTVVTRVTESATVSEKDQKERNNILFNNEVSPHNNRNNRNTVTDIIEEKVLSDEEVLDKIEKIKEEI